jgi:hypothetical protein
MPSTAIRYFRYDAAEHALEVTFVTGRRYLYDGVPPEVFEAFRTAFSKGTFFNRETATATPIAKSAVNARPDNRSFRR